MAIFEKIAHRISCYNRIRKFDLFISCFNPDHVTTILDVGASEGEYYTGANMLEKRYGYPENITALGIGRFVEFKKRYPKVQTAEYGGGHFPFADKSFDICWSNAVVEHVRPGEQRENFIKEICRVSKAVFITTPNRYFPFEVHAKLPFVHWFPKSVFDKILAVLGKGWASGEYMSLMSRKDVVRLLGRCGIGDYRIIKNRVLGLTVDFVIIWRDDE
jgi:SAM-dependent methyltransferase